MKDSGKVFGMLVSVAAAAVFVTSIALAGMMFQDRQRRAFDAQLITAQELAGLFTAAEDGLADEHILLEKMRSLEENGFQLWIAGTEGLIFHAIELVRAVGALDGNQTGAIGALDGEQAERFIRQLPSEGLVVGGGFEKFFNEPQVSAVVPVRLGALFLHRPMIALESGDLIIIWRQAGLAALAGAATGLLLALYYAKRIRGILVRFAAWVRNPEGKIFRISGRGEIAEAVREITKYAVRVRESDELRRGFLANVSHELRSPLTNIQGYLQALGDGAVPENDRAQYLGIALDEALRLGRIIDDIRALSRVESDAEMIEMKPFDMNELIRRSIAAFSGRMEEENIQASLDFREESCMALGNADLIRQVVDNLVGNAIKYVGTGGRITIRTNRTGERIFVSVADDGPGIPKEDVPFIFERFYKVDKAHSSSGSGLGLAIVKSILDRHGQAVRISSREGHGTVAAFTLDAG